MISVIIVSDSYAHFHDSIEEYIRRLRGLVNLIKIKPEKSENPILIRQKESQKIFEVLNKKK